MSTNIACSELINSLPQGFVYLTDIDPTIIESSRYATAQNFLGRVVKGYTQKRIICTLQAALQLKRVQRALKKFNYWLVVYDGYRPQQAVNDFIAWSTDLDDQVAKAQYYPTINKQDVFELGYVAQKSSHSRGSTFDVTLIRAYQWPYDPVIGVHTLSTGETIPFLDDGTVDMGSSFDLFHEVSHHDCPWISKEQTAMREFLRSVMKQHGFKEYQEEWWHYTLSNEPFPDTYFDFV